jgi:hypothetical protein
VAGKSPPTTQATVVGSSITGKRYSRAIAAAHDYHPVNATRGTPASWGWVLSRWPATPGRWRHPDRLADTAGMEGRSSNDTPTTKPERACDDSIQTTAR